MKSPWSPAPAALARHWIWACWTAFSLINMPPGAICLKDLAFGKKKNIGNCRESIRWSFWVLQPWKQISFRKQKFRSNSRLRECMKKTVIFWMGICWAEMRRKHTTRSICIWVMRRPQRHSIIWVCIWRGITAEEWLFCWMSTTRRCRKRMSMATGRNLQRLCGVCLMRRLKRILIWNVRWWPESRGFRKKVFFLT